jgi:excisionase family DNA binding protein
MLGVSRSKIYEMARCGQLPIIKAGRRILVSKLALERHVNETKIG